MNFSISYKPDQRSYIRANIALLRFTLAFRIVAVVVFILTIASIVSFFVFTKHNHPKNISPIFLLIYVVAVLSVMYIRLRKRFKEHALLSQEKKYTFTDKNILIKGASFETAIPWSEVSKITTTRKFLFIFLGKGNVLFIEKESFSASQLATILAKAGK